MPRRSVQSNSAFRYHWFVWQLMGIHAPSHIPIQLYRCYAVFINTVVTVLFPITLVANLLHSTNLQQLCENLTITVTDVIANMKFLTIFFVLPKLLQMQQINSQLDARTIEPDERSVVQRAINTAHNSFRIFCGIYVVGTLLSVLKVIFARERTLLYPAWFPADWRHSEQAYVLVFGYQLFGLMVQALQNCANDSLPPACLCMLTGQMKALQMRLRRLGGKPNVSVPVSQRALEQNYQQLVQCIEDHMNILNLHAIIQHILSVTCLAQFISSALVQCTVGLHFLYVVDAQDLSAQVLSIIFFVAVTLEVFVICYFGQLMQQQGDALVEAFYSCNWLTQLPQFKRTLILAMMRAQRPCVLLAGGYIPVDLQTFMRLLKYAYSAFTLLVRFK